MARTVSATPIEEHCQSRDSDRGCRTGQKKVRHSVITQSVLQRSVIREAGAAANVVLMGGQLSQ
eukprot:199276-Hanusia_phi.AAC.1